jgi:conjugative relaxase-like TrwC/TraI family protein
MKEPGVWAGRGAERLELRGPVRRTQFVALLRNEDPASGRRLTARMNMSRQENGETVSNRQVGYGLVFGGPKSLSVYLAITGDQVAENIARSAVARGDPRIRPRQGSSTSVGNASWRAKVSVGACPSFW